MADPRRIFRNLAEGLTPETASATAVRARPVVRESGDRALLDQFIGAAVVSCGFRSIPLTGVSIDSGSSAWYGLGSWQVPELGGECALAGYVAQLGPPNTAPTADGEFSTVGNLAAWGTDFGHGAALVIGTNLPCVRGAWTSGPANVPLVEPSGGRFQTGADERVVVYFPPASTALANPVNRLVVVQQTTPLQVPVTQGYRLDVALVVRRSQVHQITKSAGIVGFCHVSLMLGLTRTRSFAEV